CTFSQVALLRHRLRCRLHDQWQRARGRASSAALHPPPDASADRRVEALHSGANALLLRRPRDHAGADRVEAAATAVDALAAAWRDAVPGAVSGAASGYARNPCGDDFASGLWSG